MNNKTSWHRHVFWTLIGVVLISLLFWGLRPKAVLVESTVVSRGPLRVTIDEEGMTRVKARFELSAPVSGYVHRVHWEVGDRVEAGQVLATLEPLRAAVLDPRNRAEAEARVAAARSSLQMALQDVNAAEANADFAKQELQRKQKLTEQNYISEDEMQLVQSEYRRAQAALHSSRFAVEVARHNLTAAETALRYSAADTEQQGELEQVQLKSPINGAILVRHRESEGVVGAGTPLLELGDSSALEIAVDVLSFDAVQIEPGMDVIIEGWGGESLQGKVRHIEPIGFTKISALGVEEQRVWVIIDFTSPVEQWSRLGDGYRIQASFVLWQGEDILQVPSASLFRQDQGWGVFVIKDGTAQLREVTIGQRNGFRAQITEGLSEGELIVIHPDSKLADGKRVEIRQ